MTTSYANIHGFDLTEWPPAKAAWLQFSNECPQFDVSGSDQAFSKFVRRHKEELYAAGVVVRLTNGTWLGHPEKFRESIMAKLAGQSLPPMKPSRQGGRRSLPARRQSSGSTHPRQLTS